MSEDREHQYEDTKIEKETSEDEGAKWDGYICDIKGDDKKLDKINEKVGQKLEEKEIKEDNEKQEPIIEDWGNTVTDEEKEQIDVAFQYQQDKYEQLTKPSPIDYENTQTDSSEANPNNIDSDNDGIYDDEELTDEEDRLAERNEEAAKITDEEKKKVQEENQKVEDEWAKNELKAIAEAELKQRFVSSVNVDADEEVEQEEEPEVQEEEQQEEEQDEPEEQEEEESESEE